MHSTNLNLVPYSPVWKKYFLKEEEVLKSLLRKNLIQAHHIGSTAIPNICARPTLDVMAVVHTLDGIELFKDEFLRAGLIEKESALEGLITFERVSPKTSATLTRIIILDKFSRHAPDCLDFRDYLIAENEIADQFEKMKKEIVKSNKPELYEAAKIEFIQTVLKTIT
jgi:GrpB-like predicted nucleotidyltransferase (UPF0157 family)